MMSYDVLFTGRACCIWWCRFAVSRSRICTILADPLTRCHEGMESYLLALQLQAAQEVVGEEMPRRALVAKMILFGEVASALLMIQLGQFTHAGLIAVPFFLASLMAIHREHWSRSIELPDPRTVLVSVLSPQHYSVFGLRRKQEGVVRFVWSTMLLRGLCLLPLLLTLPGECPKPGCMFHFCSYDWGRERWALFAHDRRDQPPDCSWPTRWIPTFNHEPPERSSVHLETLGDRKPITDWCQRNETTWPRVPTSMLWWAENYASRPILLWPTSTSSNFSGLCSKDLNLVPAMARHSCMAGTWDPLLYQTCLKPALLPNSCNPTFLVCSYLTSDRVEIQNILVLSYILIPGTGLFLTFVIHIFAFFFGNFRTMQVQENSKLRRAVHRRTMQLQEKLQKGQLDNSLWWSRRMLESKLFFLQLILCLMLYAVWTSSSLNHTNLLHANLLSLSSRPFCNSAPPTFALLGRLLKTLGRQGLQTMRCMWFYCRRKLVKRLFPCSSSFLLPFIWMKSGGRFLPFGFPCWSVFWALRTASTSAITSRPLNWRRWKKRRFAGQRRRQPR